MVQHLVVVHEVVVGDGDESRTPNGVDQAIGSFGQEAVVDPDVVAGEDANGIPVGSPAFPHMGRGAHHPGRTGCDDVVNVDVVDDDVIHILKSQACTTSDVDHHSSPVECLVARHHAFVLQPDSHAPCEDD